MRGYAVAVQARPAGVLLAAADDDGLRLLAAAPPGTAPAAAVADFFGDDPPAVVVRVGTTPGGPFPGAPRVVAVPVAVAVLAVGPEPPGGPVLVVDTGIDTGIDAAVVEDGAVVPVAVRSAGAVAEVVGAVARRARAVEIVLAGERTVDDSAWVAEVAGTAPCPVRAAGPGTDDDPAGVQGAGPDTAAVLGAALLGAGLLARQGAAQATGDPPAARRRTAGPSAGAPASGRPGAPATTGPVPGGPVGPTTGPRAGGPGHPDPGPPDGDPDGPDRARWALPAAALLGVVLLAAGLLAGGREPPVAAPAGTAVVVQYGYAAALPAGWEHTGGDPARRRVLLTPADRPDGSDLVVVERSPLSYDAGREPARARRELDALLAGRGEVTPAAPGVVAGRAVLGYAQRPGDGTVVDWHVLFEGADQLVVGCRRPEGAAVAPACAEVVGSVRRVQ